MFPICFWGCSPYYLIIKPTWIIKKPLDGQGCLSPAPRVQGAAGSMLSSLNRPFNPRYNRRATKHPHASMATPKQHCTLNKYAGNGAGGEEQRAAEMKGVKETQQGLGGGGTGDDLSQSKTKRTWERIVLGLSGWTQKGLQEQFYALE